MKNNFYFGLICWIFLFSNTSVFAQSVSKEEATIALFNQLSRLGVAENYMVTNCSEIFDGDNLLARVFNISPVGFVVVSAHSSLPPVLAYSFESTFEDLNETNPLFIMIRTDLSNRLQYIKTTGMNYAKNNEEDWKNLLQGTSGYDKGGKLDQWPAVGDGWLKTNWTQNAPYNNFCPIDPVTMNRSIAGCPAVAMAQILNFHKSTNNTHFDDGDDYYHNYAGRQYWIDDDYTAHGFPSFSILNEHLDTLNAHYSNDITLNDEDKAAIHFACGIACTQVYTSSGSGTFGVDQAYDGYLRFGYNTVALLDESDTDLYDRLSQNIKDTLPVHLAVVDSAWSMGHNVVVDGYNSDEYYHLNFGWGGSYNGWYLLPQEIPYNLTVIEGVVLDIIPIDYTFVNDQKRDIEISAYPNPSSSYTIITFPNPNHESISISVFNSSGQIEQLISNTKENQIQIHHANRKAGVYLIVLQNSTEIIGQKCIIIE